MTPIMLLLATLTFLSLPQEGVAELSPSLVLPHDNRVVGTATNTKGDRLFTIDATGVVAEWEVDKGEAQWKSSAHQFDSLPPEQSKFQLVAGKELGGRIGPSPIPSFESVDLETGSLHQSMGLNLGGGDMSLITATTAIAIDPKDKWVWLGAKLGVGRLAAKGGSGWSQRRVDNGGVTVLTMDPKGKEVAIGGEDGTVRFVGNSSCDVAKKDIFEGHGAPIVAIAWHPKGKVLASVSGSDKVIFHNRRSGKIDRTLESKGAEFNALAYHPKGKWLAAATSRGEIVVWDLKRDEVAAQTTKLTEIESLTVWDGGKALLAASAKGVLLYDLEALGK